MKKRYEDYSCEEIKAAIMDTQKREKLIMYIYPHIIRTTTKYINNEDKGIHLDFIQETVYEFIKNINTFNCGKNSVKNKTAWKYLLAYLTTITKRKIFQHNRGKKNTTSFESNEKDFMNTLTDEEYDLYKQEIAPKERIIFYFYMAFHELGEGCQKIINFVKIQQKSPKELMEEKELLEKIGIRTITYDNVRAKLNVCREKFHKYLSKYFIDNHRLKDGYE